MSIVRVIDMLGSFGLVHPVSWAFRNHWALLSQNEASGKGAGKVIQEGVPRRPRSLELLRVYEMVSGSIIV